jgi:seryl-tRNA synthetase
MPDHHDHEARFDERIFRELQTINRKLDWLHHEYQTQGKAIMASIADIKAQSDALLAKVTAETDEVTAIKTFVDGLKAQLTDVQAQLAAAIAAGADPVALQAVADQLTAVTSGIDANATAEAAIVNTPSAP